MSETAASESSLSCKAFELVGAAKKIISYFSHCSYVTQSAKLHSSISSPSMKSKCLPEAFFIIVFLTAPIPLFSSCLIYSILLSDSLYPRHIFAVLSFEQSSTIMICVHSSEFLITLSMQLRKKSSRTLYAAIPIVTNVFFVSVIFQQLPYRIKGLLTMVGGSVSEKFFRSFRI